MGQPEGLAGWRHECNERPRPPVTSAEMVDQTRQCWWSPPLGVELGLHRPQVLAGAGLAVGARPAVLHGDGPGQRGCVVLGLLPTEVAHLHTREPTSVRRAPSPRQTRAEAKRRRKKVRAPSAAAVTFCSDRSEGGTTERRSEERDAEAAADTRRSEAEAQMSTEAGYDEWSSYPASVVTAIRSSR